MTNTDAPDPDRGKEYELIMRQQTMKVRTSFEKFLTALGAVCVSASLLSACSVEQQLPVGATLSITPNERSLIVNARINQAGICVFDPDSYIDWAIVLALTTSDGTPIAHQNVRVYLDYAENTFSGYPVMELYDDRRGNSNGVVDDFELVSASNDDIAIVKTDLYGGDRELLLRINTSCPFRGDVFAFVDGVTASSTIEVVSSENEQSSGGDS